MRPSFHPRLVNGPFDDPGLFVPLTFRKEALLFDLGDIHQLSPGDILKINYVFITHTHMDHFVGFDHLLRSLLGRGKTLHLFGPLGFLENVRGRLRSYTWNLVHNYEEGLLITATEVDTRCRTTQHFNCRDGFSPSTPMTVWDDTPLLLQKSAFNVDTAILSHQIPVLAFAVKERFHINILKPQMAKMGLDGGPWINRFKSLLFEQADPATQIMVPSSDGSETKKISIGELSHQVTRITPGQKIAYVADTAFTADNEKKIIELTRNADHLFIEAAFLEEDSSVAARKHHLTARQAGTLARKAGVREMSIFHHSPRYIDREHLLEAEARHAFTRS